MLALVKEWWPYAVGAVTACGSPSPTSTTARRRTTTRKSPLPGESGTARLEEAVAAHRAALGERTRERVPLDWAGTTLSLCLACALIAERSRDPAALAGLAAQSETARAVLRDGGHEPGAAWGNPVLGEIARITAELRP